MHTQNHLNRPRPEKLLRFNESSHWYIYVRIESLGVKGHSMASDEHKEPDVQRLARGADHPYSTKRDIFKMRH